MRSILSIATALALAGRALPQSVRVPLTNVPEDSGFVETRWTTKDGLPQNSINALLQSRDGYVWIGTFGGLARFDGQRFEVITGTEYPELANCRIVSLYEDARGRLWIGTEDGRAVCKTGEELREYTQADGLPGGTVWRFCEDREGRLWAGTSSGLALRDGDGFRVLVDDEDSALHGVIDIVPARAGHLWVLGGRTWRLAGERLEQFSEHGGLSILEGDADELFIGTLGGLSLLRDGVVRWVTEPAAMHQQIWSLLRCRDGTLVVGSSGHPIRFTGSLDSPLAEADPEVPNTRGAARVGALLEDDEGGIWVGWAGFGLSRFRPVALRGWRTGESYPGEHARAVLDDGEGGLWVASDRGVLRRSADDGLFHDVGITDASALALAHGQPGELWVGTEEGLLRARNGTVERVSADVSAAILRDREGAVWVGGDRGAQRLAVGGFEALRVPLPVGAQVQCLVEGRGGELWLGGTAGLHRWREGQLEEVVSASGRKLPAVRTVLEESPGTFWIGTYGGGLFRYRDGKLVGLTTNRGLLENVFSYLIAVEGRLVTLGNLGVSVYDLAALHEAADGRSRRVAGRLFERGPGITTAEGNGGAQPAGCIDGQGLLWFPTIEGLVALDMTQVPRHEYAPSVVIEELRGPSGSLGRPPLALVRPPVGDRNLSFLYTGVSFEYPGAVSFQHRLLGLDEHWIDDGGMRRANYSGLAPGHYEFQVRAGNVDDLWSAPAVVEVELQPHAWETWWFRVSALAVLAGLTSLALRFALQRHRAHAQRLEALVAVRTGELEHAREQLEARVEERTRELEQMLQAQRDALAERKRLEQQLLQVQKLDSVGRLAGGVAHDFNNLLTVVLGCTSLLENRLGDAPELLEITRQIQGAAERGAQLTQRLLAFARKQVVQLRVIDLNQVVVDLRDVLRRLLGADVALEVNPATEALHVEADPVQIEQVLVNLCINARDAMPDGGDLEVTLSRADSHAVLVVRDSGSGMSESVQTHAFEPFFTTKAHSGGTGLGLATCYGIVEELGGSIRIESRAGDGTSIRIELPRVDAPATGQGPGRTPVAGSGEGRTILVVEDQCSRWCAACWSTRATTSSLPPVARPPSKRSPPTPTRSTWCSAT